MLFFFFSKLQQFASPSRQTLLVRSQQPPRMSETSNIPATPAATLRPFVLVLFFSTQPGGDVRQDLSGVVGHELLHPQQGGLDARGDVSPFEEAPLGGKKHRVSEARRRECHRVSEKEHGAKQHFHG